MMNTFSEHPFLEEDPEQFPPHDPNIPDVDPVTGDERETTGPDGQPL